MWVLASQHITYFVASVASVTSVTSRCTEDIHVLFLIGYSVWTILVVCHFSWKSDNQRPVFSDGPPRFDGKSVFQSILVRFPTHTRPPRCAQNIGLIFWIAYVFHNDLSLCVVSDLACDGGMMACLCHFCHLPHLAEDLRVSEHFCTFLLP